MDDHVPSRRARRTLTSAAVLVAASVSACAPDVPEVPTWTEDVRPILVANCARCHSPPQLNDAPTYLRLDDYEGNDLELDGQVDPGCLPDVCGAGSSLSGPDTGGLALSIRINLDQDDPQHMPPDFDLSPRQKDIIDAWAANNAPKGPPLPGNREPSMELSGELRSEGTLLIGDYVIDDPDFELVTGQVIAEPDGGGSPVLVTIELFSGRGQFTWDVSDVAPGSYALTAEIDDASSVVEVDLGTVDVN
jgi:hypothetical protein